jgi:multiple sugar transport system ATP-binding protein
VSARELEELAEDAGSADLPGTRPEHVQIVARLGGASQAREGQPLELWFDPQHLQLFDPETGRSLLAAEQQQTASATVRAAA